MEQSSSDSDNSWNNHRSLAQPSMRRKAHQDQSLPSAPQGWQRLKWLGPSFLWMLSAAGSGELLFTPRIAALYGYSLLWALLAAVAFTFFWTVPAQWEGRNYEVAIVN